MSAVRTIGSGSAVVCTAVRVAAGTSASHDSAAAAPKKIAPAVLNATSATIAHCHVHRAPVGDRAFRHTRRAAAFSDGTARQSPCLRGGPFARAARAPGRSAHPDRRRASAGPVRARRRLSCRHQAAVQQFLRFPLPFGNRRSRAVDMRASPIVIALEEDDARQILIACSYSAAK